MIDVFLNLPKEIAIFLIAMLPVGELRVAIPVAINNYQMGIAETYVLTVLGNMVPVVFIVFFIEKISVYLSRRSPFFDRFFQRLFEKTRLKHSKKFELYEDLALIFFVAVPLPMTGGWSGALAAFIFGIPPKRAIPLIALGVGIAGVVVMAITKGFNFVI